MTAAYEYLDETTIDPELLCHICQEPFRDPCSAPCGEIYCRECISTWIKGREGSCPHCRQNISIEGLNKVPRSLKNMLDRLQVKCIACGETNLKQIDFDDHVQKTCPKTIVSCPTNNRQCFWRGQREHINQHLIDCCFVPMKAIFTPVLIENRQLKDQINQQSQHLIEQQLAFKLLKEQIIEQKNQNQQLKDHVNQQTLDLTERQLQLKRLKEQIIQQTNENQQLKTEIYQMNKQLNEISKQKNLPEIPLVNQPGKQGKMSYSVSAQVQLDCGGSACSQCRKCRDWHDPGYFSSFIKHDGATCQLVGAGHLDDDYVLGYIGHGFKNRHVCRCHKNETTQCF